MANKLEILMEMEKEFGHLCDHDVIKLVLQETDWCKSLALKKLSNICSVSNSIQDSIDDDSEEEIQKGSWIEVKPKRSNSNLIIKNSANNSTSKILILLRGLPGSGKTTLAKSIVTDGVIHSTDSFFYDNKGTYRFDPSLLQEAHECNRKRTEKSMGKFVSPIIIDNTNTEAWEMQNYVVLAQKYGYSIDIREPTTSWKFKPSELARKNCHGVSKEQIEKMLLRYDHNIIIGDFIGCNNNSQTPMLPVPIITPESVKKKSASVKETPVKQTHCNHKYTQTSYKHKNQSSGKILYGDPSLPLAFEKCDIQRNLSGSVDVACATEGDMSINFHVHQLSGKFKSMNVDYLMEVLQDFENDINQATQFLLCHSCSTDLESVSGLSSFGGSTNSNSSTDSSDIGCQIIPSYMYDNLDVKYNIKQSQKPSLLSLKDEIENNCYKPLILGIETEERINKINNKNDQLDYENVNNSQYHSFESSTHTPSPVEKCNKSGFTPPSTHGGVTTYQEAAIPSGSADLNNQASQNVEVQFNNASARRLIELFGSIEGLDKKSLSEQDITIQLPLHFCQGLHYFWSQTCLSKHPIDTPPSTPLVQKSKKQKPLRVLEETESSGAKQNPEEICSNSTDKDGCPFSIDPPQQLKEIMALEQAIADSLQDENKDINQNLNETESPRAKWNLKKNCTNSADKDGDPFSLDPPQGLEEIMALEQAIVDSLQNVDTTDLSNSSKDRLNILKREFDLVNPSTVESVFTDNNCDYSLAKASLASTYQRPPVQPVVKDEQAYKVEAFEHQRLMEFARLHAVEYRGKKMPNLANRYDDEAVFHRSRRRDAIDNVAISIDDMSNDTEKSRFLDLHQLLLKEAMYVLETFLWKRLRMLDQSQSPTVTLSLITGYGKHSHGGAVIKPAVISYLEEGGFDFKINPYNKGEIQVTLYK